MDEEKRASTQKKENGEEILIEQRERENRVLADWSVLGIQ